MQDELADSGPEAMGWYVPGSLQARHELGPLSPQPLPACNQAQVFSMKQCSACTIAHFGHIQTGHSAPYLRGKSQCRQWIVKSLGCCRHDGFWQMKLPVDQVP